MVGQSAVSSDPSLANSLYMDGQSWPMLPFQAAQHPNGSVIFEANIPKINKIRRRKIL